MTIKSGDVTFVDNPHAPDVFADGFSGLFFLNNNIKITLESVRVDHMTASSDKSRVVIGRLVMPLESAEQMARSILQFIDGKRDAGEVPRNVN